MFYIKPTKDGRFMFNLIANNYKIISTSQTYSYIDNTKVGINSVRNNCNVHVEDQAVGGFEVLKNPRYEVYLDAVGKPRFRLKVSNGEIIAISQAYTEKSSCLKGIESVASHAMEAEIVIDRSQMMKMTNHDSGFGMV